MICDDKKFKDDLQALITCKKGKSLRN